VFAFRVKTALWWRKHGTNLVIYLIFAAINMATTLAFMTNEAPGTNDAWRSFALDDTWIHLCYVRSLAQHGVMGYNTGEWQAGCTSPLWAMLLATIYRPVTAWGSDFVVATKAVSTLMLWATSVVLFHIGRRSLGTPAMSFLLGLVIAVEPLLAFHKASGMEGPLFSFLTALSIWFLLQRRDWPLGVSVGLLPLARPEGYFVAVPICGVVVLEWIEENKEWLLGEGPNWKKHAIPGFKRLVPIFLPLAIAFVANVLYNYSINGTPYPNTYLAKHDPTLGWFDIANLGYVWTSSVTQLCLFSNPVAMAISAAMILGGSALVVKRCGTRGLALVLIPWVMLYAVSLGARYGPGTSGFWIRRYTDPAIPFFLALFLWGASAWWCAFRPITRRSHRILGSAPGLVPLLAMLSLIAIVELPLKGMRRQWSFLPNIYAGDCEKVYDINARPGMWIKENTPEDAIVAIWEAGAVRYFGERYTIDVVGLNFPPAIGHRWFDVVREYKPDYVVAGWGQEITSIPNAQVLAVTELKLGAKAAILECSWDYKLDDPSRPYIVSTQGLVLADRLDVTDPASEKQHSYQASYASWAPTTESKLTEKAAVRDQGRAMPLPAWEEFTLASQPGKPLTLIVRHEAVADITAKVYAAGKYIGDWLWPKGEYILSESTLGIPAEYIDASQTHIRLEFAKQQDSAVVTPYYYWAYLRQ